jgi:hypothetical protein
MSYTAWSAYGGVVDLDHVPYHRLVGQFNLTSEQIEFLTDLVNNRVEDITEDEYPDEGRLYERNVLVQVLRILEKEKN